MKQITCIILILTVSLTISAKKISEEAARQNALEFLSSNSKNGPLLLKGAQQTGNVTLTQITTDDNLYIFNIGTDNGFVMISASDLTQPVLGYTDSGQFNALEVPSGLQELMNQMSSAISKIESGEFEIPYSIKSNASALNKAAIEPLLKTEWGQNAPYNAQCPTIKGSSVPTGCVATAMSQIMYFYSYPTGATSEIPAYSNYNALPATTFNWDVMRTYYGSAYDTEDNKNEVARLMHYAGQSVEMEYTLDGSGASLLLVPTALENYFGYVSGGKIITGANYYYDELGAVRTFSEWDDMLYNELKGGHPFILSGVTSDYYGHAFIIDGYDGNGYYHVNWGWDGNYNGYFTLCLLDAYSDYAFPFDQSAIIGIRPQEVYSENNLQCTIYDIALPNGNSSTLTRKSGNNNFTLGFTWGFMASLDEDALVETNFHLYDSNGNIAQQETGDSQYFSFQATQNGSIMYSSSIDNSVSFGKGLSDGTYFIKGVYRVYESTEWHPMLKADVMCLKVVISGNTATVTTYQQADLTVNSIEVEGNLRAGNTQQVKVNITNNSSEFYDQLYLFDGNTLNNAPFVVIYEGETTDIYIDYTPTLSGTHYLYLSTTSNRSQGQLGSTNVTILDSTKGMTTLNADIHTDLENGASSNATKYLYSNDLTLYIDITNTGNHTYDSYVTLEFFANGDYGTSYILLSETSFNVALEPGETRQYSYTNTDMKAGMQYFISVSNDENEELTRYSNLRVEEPSGITTITADNNEETNIYTVYGTVVGKANDTTIKEKLRQLPDGIYIFKGKKINSYR